MGWHGLMWKKVTKNTTKLDQDQVTLEAGKVIQQGQQNKGLT